MQRCYFDTSVVVAAAVAQHPHHYCFSRQAERPAEVWRLWESMVLSQLELPGFSCTGWT
ncbi:MAG: hypothetical protein HY820_40870 [Acidobacteria bacterium]|nr:hypothetical protein [Acidobacteriota bacterium]